MSRVEDDREAARLAAKLAEAKRAEEAHKQKKATDASTFSRLVAQQKEQGRVTQQDSAARSAIAELLEQAEAGKAENAHLQEKGLSGQQQEGAFKSRLGAKAFDQKRQVTARGEGQHAEQSRTADNEGQSVASQGRASDQSASARGTESRHTDSKSSKERLEERKESNDAANAGRAGAPKGGKGELKTDADKGGQGQQGGGKDQKDGAMNPGFRFNPALMAPVPVAKAKEATGSERLRKVANELAQKIVERVRIGTNAAGRVEFQVDLRNDVLSGLTVKVSSHNGKIKAVFQGSDRDVLKMIEENEAALKEALAARGLSLEDFSIEART